MLGRLAWVTVFALLAVREVAACSMMPWDPDRLVENEVVSSANGRFRAVVRRYEGVPDFSTRLARDVLPDPPERNSVTVALYESRLLVEFPIDRRGVDEVFVSDSGRYLVALQRLSGSNCGYTASNDPFVTVYRADGTLVGSLKVDDVLGSWDLWNVIHGLRYGGVVYGLRPESDTREVFVVKIQTSETEWVERRIDVATASLLDPKIDIFPRPRAYVTPVDVPTRAFLPAAADCAAAFDAPGVVRMQSRHFYGRAVFGPVPEFPSIMVRARVRGPVIVDVVVSEYGEVLCTRASGLPFGGTDAASNAARRWRFRPMTVDGRRVKFAGELLFQFQDIDEEKWRDLMRYAPPFEE